MTRRSLLQYFAATVILSAVATLLLDRVVMPLYVRQGQVRYLPNVVGQPYEEGARILEAEGFAVMRAKVTPTREYPPDQIFEMYPEAYARVKKGRIIQLTVTAEESMVTVPDIIGKTERAARIEIARAGLHIDTVLTKFSDVFATGTVIWQSPMGGNDLRRGDGLDLLVSLGEPPPTFYVPSVVGMGLQAGRSAIRDAGLDDRVTYLYTPIYLPNTIIDQNIAGGTVLQFKRAITLTVSTLDQSQE